MTSPLGTMAARG